MSLERFLCIDGVEVANPVRVLTYMANIGNSCLPAPPPQPCPCPDWLPGSDVNGVLLADPADVLTPDDTDEGGLQPAAKFTTPWDDDAPWYDPAVPESADVLGVWIEELRMATPYTRKSTSGQRGATLGRRRYQGREIQIAGWLYATSAAGTAYGRQWLGEALAGDECAGESEATVYTFCDPLRANAGKRTLKRVGLTAYDPEVEEEFPRVCGLKFAATLIAGVPELMHDPVQVLAIADVLDGAEEVCNLCSPCPDTTYVCTCDVVPTVPRVVPAADPAAVFCQPILTARTTQVLPSPDMWRDATTIISVTSGAWPVSAAGLSNLRLRAWPNPAGLSDASYFECQDPCLDVEVGCIPANGTLIIDGTTRTATVICGDVEHNGYAYLSSAGSKKFEWPDVSCDGLLLVIDADPYGTPTGTSLSIEYVTRERS